MQEKRKFVWLEMGKGDEVRESEEKATQRMKIPVFRVRKVMNSIYVSAMLHPFHFITRESEKTFDFVGT